MKKSNNVSIRNGLERARLRLRPGEWPWACAFLGLFLVRSALGSTLELVGGQAAGSLRTQNYGVLRQQPFQVSSELLKAGYNQVLAADNGARKTDSARISTQVSSSTFVIKQDAELQISSIQNEVLYQTRLQFRIPPTQEVPAGRPVRIKVKARGWTEPTFWNAYDTTLRPIGIGDGGVFQYTSPIDGKTPSLIFALASKTKDLTFTYTAPPYYSPGELSKDLEVGDIFNVDLDLFACNTRGAQTAMNSEVAVSYELIPSPEIEVELMVNGLSVADGFHHDFSHVNVEESSEPLTFIIKNLGTLDLTGLRLWKDGQNAEDFNIGSLGVTTLSPGGSTSFTLTFAPSTFGTRMAAIHISSNDANENPFDMIMSGTGDQITPVVTWVNPAAIVYGTLLSASQLRATADVAGRFDYSPHAATLLPVGTHALSVAFTPADPNRYTTAGKAVLLTVNKAPATVTLNGLSQEYNGDPRQVTATTVPEGLNVVVTYPNVWGLPVDAGSYAVTATVEDGNYTGSKSATLVVAKGSQTITFPSPPALCFGDADCPLNATARSHLPVIYASSAPGVAIIVDRWLHIVAGGNVTVTASQPGNANWNAAPVVAKTLAISKKSQTIIFPAISSYVTGDADFSPGAMATSGLPVSYASANAAVATLVNGNIHVVGAGSAVIIATQLGNAGWAAANPVSQTLLVNKGNQTISFPALPSKGYGDADFSPGAIASSGLPVSYASSNPSVASILAGKIHITGFGTTAITATQAGSANWNPADQVSRPLSIEKPAAKVVLSGLSQTYNGQPRVVMATTIPAGLRVVFDYAGAADGPVNAGAYGVTATVEDDTYAGSSRGTLVIAKGSQTITFAAPPALCFGDADCRLAATASSLLPVIYASSAPAVATLLGSNLHVVGGGNVTVTASQPGDANWNAAPSVAKALTISKKSQTIDFPSLPSRIMGDADITPDATATSGLPVSYVSERASVATIVNGKIHVVGAGSAVIAAAQPGNPSWGSATPVRQTLVVGKGDQTISFPVLPSKGFGDADFAPGASASSGLPVSYASSNPSAVTIVAGKIHLVGFGTATITATQAGSANWTPAAAATQIMTVFLKLAVTGGGIGGELNPALVSPGDVCQVTATGVDGKAFNRWIVFPAAANLGGMFNARGTNTTVSMPSVNVTLKAEYVPIPTLTVMGGGIDGDVSPATVLPGAARQVFASADIAKVFEKWTVAPATAGLGEAFNPRKSPADLVMPSVNVTLTAAYVTAPGFIGVSVSGNVPKEVAELSGIFWSVDNVTWVPVNDGKKYPLKPGSYTISFKSVNLRWLVSAKQTVKVLFDQRSEVSSMVTYVPAVSWRLSGENGSGSGTVALSPSNGQVLPGKSVTLTAQSAADSLFVGWEGLEEKAPGEERRPSITVAPARDAVYTARFRAKSECAAPEISVDSAAGMVGVAYRTVVGVNDRALPVKFSAAGLPAGLAIDAVTGVISGVPTKPGASSVTVSAINVKGTATQAHALTVAQLPRWAQGSFYGVAYLKLLDPLTGDGADVPGVASLSATAQGKITGKIACGGITYAFSAASYSPSDEEVGTLMIKADAKAGKAILPLSFSVRLLEIACDGCGKPEILGAAEGCSADTHAVCVVTLWRYIWKDPELSAFVANYSGYYTATLLGGEEYGSGYLTLTVDTAGAVKVAGKLADGTAITLSGTLVLDQDGRVFVVLYAAPPAYKGGGIFGFAELVVRPEDGVVLLRPLEGGGSIMWENRNPQATAEYGAGFARGLGLSGGWYDKVINLRDYYETGLAVGGVEALPPFLATVKITDYDPESERDPPPKISWTDVTEAEDAGVSPNGLVLGLTPATGIGTGLTAPRAQTPVKHTDPDTGESWYNYDELENPSGLTFAFTRATGLFKGAFNVYYDYVSADDYTTGLQTLSHITKKGSYEGVLTPVRMEGEAEGRGFFLWSDKGWYETGKVDRYGDPVWASYSFNWSYDFLLLGN